MPVQEEQLTSGAQQIPLMDEEHHDTDPSTDKVCQHVQGHPTLSGSFLALRTAHQSYLPDMYSQPACQRAMRGYACIMHQHSALLPPSCRTWKAMLP